MFQTFSYALSSDDIKQSITQGKIAGLLGVEGQRFLPFLIPTVADTSHSGHQLGNSISVLRQYYALGVRYVTLTHTCHNAFADSCGYLIQIAPLHYGLRFSMISHFNTVTI